MPSGRERAWRLGLVAVVLLVVGSGLYQAVKVPPYYMADEQAHVGYVLELERGRMPTVDTPIAADRGGEALRAKMAISPLRNRDVWVANNPPWPYLPAIPAAALTSALGVAGGPLLGLRLVNLLFFAAAVVALARLARRLAGDDPSVGLLAAGLFAAVPHVGATAGAAFVDGAALLCTIAVTEAVVAITQSGPTRRQVVTLSVWSALAVGVRPMTAVVAAAAAGVALAVVTLRWWRSRAAEAETSAAAAAAAEAETDVGAEAETETETDAASATAAGPGGAGLVTPWWAALVLGAPPVVLSGWSYVRNQMLYGDPTGSSRLFEKFGRTARTWPDAFQTRVWAGPTRSLLNRRIPQDVPGPPLWLWDLTRWTLAAFIVATVVLVTADQVRARRRREPARTPLLGWAATALGAAVIVVLTAQHWTGGGNIHPRYLLFPLAVLAVAVALPLVRARARWAGVLLVAALIALQGRQIRQQNAFLYTPTWLPAPPSPLLDPIGPPFVRALGVAIVALGGATLVVAMVGVQPPAWLAHRAEAAWAQVRSRRTDTGTGTGTGTEEPDTP